jgi:competence ComEA-like helix-hairpin-helix protein
MKLFALSLIIAASSAAVEKVNINMADATALDKIYNVGSVTAQRIINHRKNVAPFASVEELKLINGIGQATFDTMMQKGNDGSYAKPVVGVACPMTCEVKSVHYHKDLAVNDTTILKIQHVSNLASGAHGPATKHPLCGGSKAKFCAPRQRLLHKCYKIGDGSTCACVCDVCTDAHNKAPCHPNKICGDDVAGDPLVYDSATDKCLKCGRWSGDRACANNMCLATDVNHAHKQLVYDPVAKKCARCGHGHNKIACDNNVCEATSNSNGKRIHYNALSGKCGHCGEWNGAPACGGTTCSVTDTRTGRKLALNTNTLTCVRCGHENGATPCPLNGNPTCETEDVNFSHKKLVYDPATGKCKRCGHGHNMHACEDPNTVCEATSITTGKRIAFNPDNGKCWNCGTKHNLPACNHASHAAPCAVSDFVTGNALVLDAATGKCVNSP